MKTIETKTAVFDFYKDCESITEFDQRIIGQHTSIECICVSKPNEDDLQVVVQVSKLNDATLLGDTYDLTTIESAKLYIFNDMIEASKFADSIANELLSEFEPS